MCNFLDSYSKPVVRVGIQSTVDNYMKLLVIVRQSVRMYVDFLLAYEQYIDHKEHFHTWHE